MDPKDTTYDPLEDPPAYTPIPEPSSNQPQLHLGADLTDESHKRSNVFRRLSQSVFGSSISRSKSPSGITSTTAPSSNPRALRRSSSTATEEDLAALARFDTLFLIDDSGSMTLKSSPSSRLSHWAQVGNILFEIVGICTKWDRDGVDVGFFNMMTKFGEGMKEGIKDPKEVMRLFDKITPSGGTPTALALDMVVAPYLQKLTAAKLSNTNTALPKPLNVIVFTDGAADNKDALKANIINYARTLDSLRVPADQLGIQFFQVGAMAGVSKYLEELDNCLGEERGVRDIVDTRSSEAMGTKELTALRILTVVLGAVNRRLDITVI